MVRQAHHEAPGQGAPSEDLVPIPSKDEPQPLVLSLPKDEPQPLVLSLSKDGGRWA